MPTKKVFSYNKKTVQKALVWLQEQKQDLASHITDVNLAVKLYLKYHEKKDETPFMKELKAYAGIQDQKDQEILSPPSEVDFSEVIELKDKLPTGNSIVSENSVSMGRRNFLERTEEKEERSGQTFVFSLDEKSEESLEKAQSQLNLPREETLRVLIQLGCHSLKNFFK